MLTSSCMMLLSSSSVRETYKNFWIKLRDVGPLNMRYNMFRIEHNKISESIIMLDQLPKGTKIMLFGPLLEMFFPFSTPFLAEISPNTHHLKGVLTIKRLIVIQLGHK